MLFLDTNIFSVLAEGMAAERAAAQAALLQLAQTHNASRWATSALCVAECLVGAGTHPDASQRTRLEASYRLYLDNPALYVMPISNAILTHATALRVEAINQGGSKKHRKHLPDAIIAASCLSLPGAVMVTHNVSDFDWVPGLTVVAV